MLPSFNRMGSKARIRNWLINYFPIKGDRYIEVFAGNANVYFSAVNKLEFNRYILNDKYSYKFLSALIEVDITKLPIEFGNKELETIKLKQCLNKTGDKYNTNYSPIELVIEHLVSFGGKGYEYGVTTDGYARYKRDKIISKINCAKSLLSLAEIFSYDWEDLNYQDLTQEDFIYFDPPYFKTKASYPNIDHCKLIEVINEIKCKWALSGYDNYLYNDLLEFKNKYQIERNSELKGAVNNGKSLVVETLWTNF